MSVVLFLAATTMMVSPAKEARKRGKEEKKGVGGSNNDSYDFCALLSIGLPRCDETLPTCFAFCYLLFVS